MNNDDQKILEALDTVSAYDHDPVERLHTSEECAKGWHLMLVTSHSWGSGYTFGQAWRNLQRSGGGSEPFAQCILVPGDVGSSRVTDMGDVEFAGQPDGRRTINMGAVPLTPFRAYAIMLDLRSDEYDGSSVADKWSWLVGDTRVAERQHLEAVARFAKEAEARKTPA